MDDEQQQAASRSLRWVVVAALILPAAAVGATLAVLDGGGSDSGDGAGEAVAAGQAESDEPGEEPATVAAVEEVAEPPPDDDHADGEGSPAAASRPVVEKNEAQQQIGPAPDSAAVVEEPVPEDAEFEPPAEMPAPAPEPTPDPPPPATPESPPAVDPATLGLGPFARPITGVCFPDFAGQLPGAPREYRNGTHEGVDFYPGWACAAIERGTPVLAIAEGRVIRADGDYADLTVERYFEMKARGFTGPDDLDAFRGRQVWVDHGDGIVARYAHLNGIAEGMVEGVSVSAGTVLAFVGESGTPGGLREAGSEVHLHFELRVGEVYLGQGLGPEGALALYRAVFPD